ncbi:MAG: MBL fold metallo-hydrolase [Prevotella sp.]|nr:MBL fold metallo-hydrolase [Prevotella sp.]
MKTYRILAVMLLALIPYTVQAQVTDINSRDLRGKVVYQDDEVVFRQLDEHTWIGNGHRLYNESLYLIEGNERAILIDAGVYIPDLDKIVAKITSKPVTMMLTHAHGDHVGGVGPFPEVYLNAGDMTIVPNNMRNYKGQIRYLNDGQVIDLGGREIEVIFTPGHTAGSATFFDKAQHYGFSGDAFGSTNLLVFTNLSTEMYTAERIENYMKKNDIRFLFPGHYSGDNLESPQRVTDIKNMCREVLDGVRKPTASNGNNGGMDMMVDDKGVRINFSSRTGMK